MALHATEKVSNGVVLITGASAGIGLATCRHLANRGYTVFAGVRETSQQEALDAAIKAGEGRLFKVILDVQDSASVDLAVKEVINQAGRIDVLVNNAAFVVTGNAETCSDEQINKMFDTNVLGPIRLVRAVAPWMRKQAQGMIVNISSMCGIRAYPLIGIYSATKFALEGLTEAWAVDYHPYNIKVVSIQPGPVKTQAAVKQPLGARQAAELNPFFKYNNQGAKLMTNSLAAGQEPDEVAELIGKVIQEEKPHLRYQTGACSAQIAQESYKDVHGDASLKKMVAFFEEQKLFGEPS